MTFRVIKSCKHSPGGPTVISNLFYCSLPSSLFPLPIFLHHLTHLLTNIRFLLSQPPASISPSYYKPLPLFPFDFLLLLSVSGPFLLMLCSPLCLISFSTSSVPFSNVSFSASLVVIVTFGAVVWSCSSLVDFCYIKPNPVLTHLSLDPLFISLPSSTSFCVTAPPISSSPLLTFVFICLLTTFSSLILGS